MIRPRLSPTIPGTSYPKDLLTDDQLARAEAFVGTAEKVTLAHERKDKISGQVARQSPGRPECQQGVPPRQERTPGAPDASTANAGPKVKFNSKKAQKAEGTGIAGVFALITSR